MILRVFVQRYLGGGQLMKASTVRVVALFLVVGLWTASGRADTLVNWQGPGGTGSGNWSTAADWSGGVVPNNGSTKFGVTLPTESTSYTVTQDINVSIDSLTVDSGATLAGNSGITLTVTSLTSSGIMNYDSANNLTVNGATTISSGASLNLEGASTASLNGTVSNSGSFVTGFSGGSNTVTVTGAFTNNAGATLALEGSGDVMNVASLANSGTVTINAGTTMNLTGQPNGITDVAAGSTLTVAGTLKAGTANGLAKLTSVEGTLDLENGTTNAVTPTGGTLTIASGGQLELSATTASTTTLSITGAVNNSGSFTTGFAGGANTVTVSGAFTNNAGASLDLEGSSDVVNVASLTNLGTVSIASGDTVNLTSQPNGITDVPAGSVLTVTGTLNAGSANGLAKLTSVEGQLNLQQNGKTTSVTPSGGTLTVASGGSINLSDTVASNTTLSITGGVNNSGSFTTGFAGGTNTVNVSGAFTNNAGAQLTLQSPTDVVNVASLSNSGTVTIDTGATLNLTNQPNGITDVPQGSILTITGSLKAGSANGLAKLTTVEGQLNLQNGQTNAVTPSGGTLTVANTGSVNLSDNVASTTTLSITGGVNNSGQFTTGFAGGTNTVNVSGAFTNNSGAFLELESSTDVVNVATLTNSGTVDVSTNTSNGATLNLTASGTDSNTGTINLGSASGTGTLKISGSAVTLSGTGKVIMSNLTGNLITGAAATDILTSANTIEGSGTIGNGNMGFVNTGTVLANQSTALIIDPSSSGFNNKGTLNVSAGDELQIPGPANSFLNYSATNTTLTNGTYLVSGTLQFGATGNTITTDNAKITLTGAAAKIVDPSGGNILAPLATIGAGSLFDITSGAKFTTQGNFTNNGTLTVGGGGSKFVVKSGSNLTNFSGTTLTGGTYNVTGTLQFGASGTSLVTNAASITLTGAQAKIISSAGASILTNFATNNAGATFDIANGFNFTTVGNFTNNGSLIVGTNSKFDVNGNLTNFNSGTDTLMGGIYNVTGTLQFNNANIVTNSANLTLNGGLYKIDNQTAGDGLANFATNSSTGSFTLAKNASFSSLGTLTNSGTVKVNKGSTLTIGASGNYTQTAGNTTVDGTLVATGAGIIQVSGGNVFGNGGNLNGNTSNSGTLNIGDAVKTAGADTVSGAYTQNSAGALDIDIGGSTAGTKFDQLTVTGAASLNGTLNLDLINNFVPTVGSMFDILNASTLNGTTFATVTGTGINSSEHFTVIYNTNNVTLDVVAGMGPLLAQNVPLNSPTPEPGSLLLLGTGFAALGTYWRRRRNPESSVPGK